MSSPLLTLPGAVPSPAGDGVWHFGNPLREARDYEAGDAVTHRSDLGVVSLGGADRLRWLNSLTTQRLDNLQPGDSCETLLLSPQGRIEQQLWVCEAADATLILLPATQVHNLIEFVEKMRFTLDVTATVATAEFALLGYTVGLAAAQDSSAADNSAATAVGALGFPVAKWVDPWWYPPAGGYDYTVAEHPAEETQAAVIAVLPQSALQKLANDFNAGVVKPAGLLAVLGHEIAAWRPRDTDFDSAALPHEFNLLRSAVHLQKGCYRGQETVAKVHNLGHPPRRFTMLQLDGSSGELPDAGALVYLDDAVEGAQVPDTAKPVGRVTRAVVHQEQGAIAVALLKRAVPETAPLAVATPAGNAVSAVQEIIVPPSAGGLKALDPELRRALRQI